MFKFIITLALTFTLFIKFSYSQSQYDFKCGFNQSYQPLVTPLGMGLFKPMKTTPKEDLNKYFRVLMIYVEYLNDNEGSTAYWAPRNLPVYANQLFAPQKQLGINAYEQYKISDYFNKVSRDDFDVIADVYHVILDYEYSYYQNHLTVVIRNLN